MVLLWVIIMLPVSGNDRVTVEEQGPELIPADIYNQRQMTQLLKNLNAALPEEAAEFLEIFAEEFDLDPDARPEPPRDIHEIKIDGRRFTPEPGVDQQLAEIIEKSDTDDFVIAYMQLEEMPSLRDYIILSQMKVRGLFKGHWIGHSTFIIAFPVAIYKELLELPQLRWLGYYSPGEKIRIEHGRIPTALVTPVDTDRDEYREYFANARIGVRQFDETLQKYLVNIQPQEAEQLAGQWWVRSVEFLEIPTLEQDLAESELHKKFLPQDSRIMSSAESIWPVRTGTGVRVGLIDTNPDAGHPDFGNVTFLPGSDTGTQTHGTHVSGIIAARNSGTGTLSGTYGAQGIAPGAVLYSVDLNGTDVYTGAFQRFRNNNIRLSNHSWGWTNSINTYQSTEEDFDRYVADDDHIVIKSAGNNGIAGSNISRPGTGKNVIAVGSVRYLTDDDRENREIGGISVFSSGGPSVGRLKPDLVAPGGQTNGDYGYRKYGVVSLNPDGNTDDNLWPEDSAYRRSEGTSMAAPHVTGTAALMLQTWNNLSSQAFKARLIGTTIPVKAGGDNPRSGYANTSAGYGLLNAFNAAGLKSGNESETLKWVKGTVKYSWGLGYDDEFIPFAVPPNVERLIFVLAYNDVPGGDGDLVHNLELKVSGPGVTNRTPSLPAGVTNKSALQKLVIEDPQTGPWSATVTFLNPGIFDVQDYSLFVYAIYKTPELDVISVSHPGNVDVGETFIVSMTVENIGGWIAAGVTARVQGSGFEGEVDFTKNVRNLKFQGDNVIIEFELTALQPAFDGSIINIRSLEFCADAVNREIEPVCTGVNIGIRPPWLFAFDLTEKYLIANGISTLNIVAQVQNSDGSAAADRTMVAFITTLGTFGRETLTLQPTVNGKATATLTSSTTRGIAVVTALLEDNKDISRVTKVYFTPEGIGVREFHEETIFDSGVVDAGKVIGGKISVEATGLRTITAAAYSDNPVRSPASDVVSKFINVHIDRRDDIEMMELEFCAENFLTETDRWRSDYILHYWDGSDWTAASDQEFDGTGCTVLAVTERTSPDFSDFSDIVFAAMTPVTSVTELEGVPELFALHQNYPNPFNPVTTIRYDVPEQSMITISIYNVLGQRVRELVNTEHAPGYYRVIWDGTNANGRPVTSGMYIYRITAGDYVSSKRLVITK